MLELFGPAAVDVGRSFSRITMKAFRGLILGVLTTATAASGYVYYARSETETFLTAPVERGHIAVSIKATGTAKAKQAVDVSSQLSGRIASVLVDFNDEVKAGQPIARLDPESYTAKLNQAKAALEVALSTAALNRAAVERAQANLANARASNGMSQDQLVSSRIKHEETARDLQRKAYLARGGSVSESELSRTRSQSDAEEADLRASTQQLAMKEAAIGTAEAELHMAEANVKNADAVVQQKQAEIEQARVDLDRTVIRAPIDGIILKRDVNPGQTVAVSLEAKTLFTIANDLRQIEVHGRIDEADIGTVNVGQLVIFSVDAFPDREFTGHVTQIRRSPEVSHNVVTYTTIVSADNPDLLLLPGMTATMRIQISDSGLVLKVPNQALRFQPELGISSTPAGRSDGRGTIWRLGSDGKPLAVPVKLGASDSTGTAIIEGPLRQGEPVIVGTARKVGSSDLSLRLGL